MVNWRLVLQRFSDSESFKLRLDDHDDDFNQILTAMSLTYVTEVHRYIEISPTANLRRTRSW